MRVAARRSVAGGTGTIFRSCLQKRRLQSSSAGDRNRLIVSIDNASFYDHHPAIAEESSVNRPVATGLSFSLTATSSELVGKPERTDGHWAIIGANPTPILDILRGQYICHPPTSRSYPYLSSDEIARKDSRLRVPSRAIQYVGFNAGSVGASGGSAGVRGAYLSARYESRREETDWTLEQYLKGETELNPSKQLAETIAEKDLAFVVEKLYLRKLLNMPVSNLSNGQTRRSRIAKALLSRPEVLLLDEPFMGLDPPTLSTLSPMLRDLAYRSSPLLVLGLRPQDPIPDWITHLAVVGEDNSFLASGRIEDVLYRIYSQSREHTGIGSRAVATDHQSKPPFSVASILTPGGVKPFSAIETIWQQMQSKSTQSSDHGANDAVAQVKEQLRSLSSSSTGSSSTVSPTPLPATPAQPTQPHHPSTPLIELNSITLTYGPRTVLGHPPHPLSLTISRGTRLLLLGPNGSGKTTLLSLLTSDHPQSYSLPIKFFGRTRLPSPGIPGLSLWEIQSRIGHSSPEVHAFFPRNFTVRRVLESAWAETFSSKPELNAERSQLVDHFLRVWQNELCQDHAMLAKGEDGLAWASDRVTHPAFGRLPFGTQRLLLLLRAVIKQPDIVILDEAFSGLSSVVRDKALGWLESGDASLPSGVEHSGAKFPGLTQDQALVVVSHVREEIPDSISEYVRLPSEEEAGEGKDVLAGTSETGYIKSVEGWNDIWGLPGGR